MSPILGLGVLVFALLALFVWRLVGAAKRASKIRAAGREEAARIEEVNQENWVSASETQPGLGAGIEIALKVLKDAQGGGSAIDLAGMLESLSTQGGYVSGLQQVREILTKVDDMGGSVEDATRMLEAAKQPQTPSWTRPISGPVAAQPRSRRGRGFVINDFGAEE